MRLLSLCAALLLAGAADAFVSHGLAPSLARARGGAAACAMSSGARPALTNPLRRLVSRTSPLVLRSSSEDTAAITETEPEAPPTFATIDIESLAGKISRATWLAWWLQTILSVVAAVTIFFANAVKGPAQTNLFTNGIFLAGIGLAVAFVNVFWTWGYSRMGAKLLTTDDAPKQVRRLRGSIKLGVIIALTGQLITLFGAQQIVGTLVAKSISGSIFFSGAAAASPVTQGMQLQALDIFVVQANTNTLLSHLVSLISALYVTSRLPKD